MPPRSPILELIGDIQDEFAGYGYRRVTRALHKRGYRVTRRCTSAGTVWHSALGCRSPNEFEAQLAQHAA